jgi:hypothetical protein
MALRLEEGAKVHLELVPVHGVDLHRYLPAKAVGRKEWVLE